MDKIIELMSTTTIIILAAVVLAGFIFAMYSEAHYGIKVLQRRLSNLDIHKETLVDSFNKKLYVMQEEQARLKQRIADLEHRNDIEDLAQ